MIAPISRCQSTSASISWISPSACRRVMYSRKLFRGSMVNPLRRLTTESERTQRRVNCGEQNHSTQSKTESGCHSYPSFVFSVFSVTLWLTSPILICFSPSAVIFYVDNMVLQPGEFFYAHSNRDRFRHRIRLSCPVSERSPVQGRDQRRQGLAAQPRSRQGPGPGVRQADDGRAALRPLRGTQTNPRAGCSSH